MSSGYFNYGGSIRRAAEPLGAAFAGGSEGHSRRGRRCLPSAHPPCLLCVAPAPLELLEFSVPEARQRVTGWGQGVVVPKKRHLESFRVFQLQLEAARDLGGWRAWDAPAQSWEITHPTLELHSPSKEFIPAPLSGRKILKE